MKLYTIFDRVAEESGPVFEAKNDGVALRKFQALALNTEGAQPDDFKLLSVGEIDHDIQKISQTEIKEITANVNLSGENEDE